MFTKNDVASLIDDITKDIIATGYDIATDFREDFGDEVWTFNPETMEFSHDYESTLGGCYFKPGYPDETDYNPVRDYDPDCGEPVEIYRVPVPSTSGDHDFLSDILVSLPEEAKEKYRLDPEDVEDMDPNSYLTDNLNNDYYDPAVKDDEAAWNAALDSYAHCYVEDIDACGSLYREDDVRYTVQYNVLEALGLPQNYLYGVKINVTDAEEIVTLDKEFDDIDDWNDRFVDYLKSIGKEPYQWDYDDLGTFFRQYGYETFSENSEKKTLESVKMPLT